MIAEGFLPENGEYERQNNHLGAMTMKMQLNLLDNAYDFLNESLAHYTWVDDEPANWKFALLNLVHAMELLFKERLRREHAVLIFDDVDKRKNTVSLSSALDRLLSICGLPLTTADKNVIEKAIKWRNQVMHYEVEVDTVETNTIYCIIFEFLTTFHNKYLDGELHHKIRPEFWDYEALLMDFFRSEIVVYNGVEMHRSNPKDIVEAQYYPTFVSVGEAYLRIKYGEETRWQHDDPHFFETPCHDCGVRKRQYHTDGCDVEECPKCHGQLLSCDCELEYGEPQEPVWPK